MNQKLSPHFVWLFAVGAMVGGLAISFLTAKMGWKVSAGAFFAFVGLASAASAWMTRSTTLQAIGPFVIASFGLAGAYYLILKKVMTAAASSIGAGSGAAGGFGAKAAMLFAGIVLIDVLVASVSGALFGIKLRSVKSFGDLAKRPA